MKISDLTSFSHRVAHMAGIAVLDPRGTIALQEKHLLSTATWLMLLIVVPVFLLTIVIAYHYRAGNKKAKYLPNWEHNKIQEFIWWGVPTIIVGVLAVLTWTSTHTLDPYRSLESDQKPITIQVVALDWKWLFIYPEQGIATLNFFEIPEGVPINLEVTADAPMNSLWIPQLGGQIYAMPGMSTQLHLMADGRDDYRGSSANFSGRGFAGMTFFVRSRTREEFAQWVSDVRQSPDILDRTVYGSVRAPSTDEPIRYYGVVSPQLYTTIVDSFMRSASSTHSMHMNSM
jgi:cytochrome o ubiquinol oxidase subunit 2